MPTGTRNLKKNKTQREKEIILIFCFLDSTDTCFIFYSSQESILERVQPRKLAQAPNPKEIILWEVKSENGKLKKIEIRLIFSFFNFLNC